MDFVWYYDYPIGRLSISCNDKGITGINLGDIDGIEKETELIKKAAAELGEYFEGKRKYFDFPIYMDGTEFQIKVWKELMKIPYGQTRSYKDIAASIGMPKASRAVGTANKKNRLMIVIPCHRVIASDGSLSGYALGVHIKKYLIELEKNIKSRID